MAKYEIHYKCGHSETVKLFGKAADRERKIFMLEQQDCPECRRAAHAAEMAAKSEDAKAEANSYKLPELTGTEKQVNWALDIRRNALAEVKREAEALAKGNDDTLDLSMRATIHFNGEIFKNSSAKYWIDNRDELRNISARQMIVKSVGAVVLSLRMKGYSDEQIRGMSQRVMADTICA